MLRAIAAVFASLLVAGPVFAQTPAQVQTCLRLEAELARLDRPALSDPNALRRLEDSAARQQAELDRTIAQAQRLGCTGASPFFLFGTFDRSPQCDGLDRQIDRIRRALDRQLNQLAQARGPQGYDRDVQRRQLMAALGHNNCGAQYRTATSPPPRAQPGDFFEQLFGRPIGPPGGGADDDGFIPDPGGYDEGLGVGTYRTLCVRTCDGFYFPISFSATPLKFGEDEKICRAQCPGAEAMLFAHRNPGEDVAQAVSPGGQTYSALPNAFRYRQTFDASCSCKPAGQTWAQAIGHLDNTVQRGDIVMTEEKSKELQQKALQPAPRADQRSKKKGKAQPEPVAALPPPPEPAPVAPELSPPPAAVDGGRQVRAVGPTFYPVR